MVSAEMLTTPSPFSESIDSNSNGNSAPVVAKTRRNKYFPREAKAAGDRIGNLGNLGNENELGSISSSTDSGPLALKGGSSKSSHKKKMHRRMQTNDLILPPLAMSPNAMMPPLPSATGVATRRKSNDKMQSPAAMTSPKKNLFPEPTSPTSVMDDADVVRLFTSPPSADEADLDIAPSIPTTKKNSVPKKHKHRRYVSVDFALPPKSPSTHSVRTHQRISSMEGSDLGAINHLSLRSVKGGVGTPSSTAKKGHRRSKTLDVGAVQRLTHSPKSIKTAAGAASAVVPASAQDANELQALSDNVRRLKAKSAGNKPCPELAAAWNRLGNYHFKVGSHRMALECYHRALETIARTNSSSEEDSTTSDLSDAEKTNHNTAFVAHTKSNMGTVYWAMGQHEIAVEMLEESYQSILELRGKDHLATSNALHNLGQAYFLKGDLDAASRTLKEALESRKLSRGHRHVDVARTTSVLAAVELRRGNNKEALKLFEVALTMKRWLLGGNHATVVISMLDVANARKACGRLEDAIKMYSDALRVQRVLRCNGRTNTQDIAMTLHARGNLYANMGNTDEAVRSLKEAYLMYLDAGTPNDSSLVKCLKESLKVLDRVEEE